MKELPYHPVVRDKILQRLPGAYVIKNDPKVRQGLPDFLILYQDKWAMLEVKKDPTAKHRPNQDYYIEQFGKMSFASFIDPTTEEEVLDALQAALGAAG